MTAPIDPPVRVWDLPTRIFHWLLAATLVGSVTSAKIGGEAMAWHFRFGYLVFTLLAFRLVWGLVGGRWSRFSSFIFAPRTTLAYLRGRVPPGVLVDVGHNPLGNFSVFALLGVLALQVATGLVADDEIANSGPLNRFVASATALAATGWHKNYGQWLVIGLVALHLAAIAWYVWGKRVVIVRPMVSGDKALPAGTPASADGTRERLLALLLAALCAAGVIWLVRLGG